MIIPYRLLRLLPMWEFQCPNCKTIVEKNNINCPNCQAVFNEEKWRIPPKKITLQKLVLKHFAELAKIKLPTFETEKEMCDYAHNILAPMLSSEDQKVLFQYFTTFLTSGWENSGGVDLTDAGKWTSSIITTGCTVSVVASPVHSGNYAMNVNAIIGGGGGVYLTFGTPQAIVYVRMYMYIESGMPYADQNFFGNTRQNTAGDQVSPIIYNSATDNYWGLYVSINGGISQNTYLEAAPSNPTTLTWYCVEWVRDVTNSSSLLWVDGNLKVDRTGLDVHIGNSTLSAVDVDYARGAACIVDFDDAIISDSYNGPMPTIPPLKSIRDIFARTVVYYRKSVEQPVISDHLGIRKGIFRFITENLSSLQDNFSYIYKAFHVIQNYFRYLTENVNVSASFKRVTAASRRQLENLTIRELPNRILKYRRKLTEASVISAVFKRGITYSRLQKEASFIQDNFKRASNYIRRQIENFLIKDVSARIATYRRQLSESPFIQDNFKRISHYIRGLQENLSFLNDVFRRGKATYSRLQKEIMLFQDTFSRRIYAFRKFIETFLVQGVFNYVYARARHVFTRAFSELILIQDIMSRRVSASRLQKEIILIRDIVSRRISASRKAVETFLIQDIFKRAAKYSRTLQETLAITDNLKRTAKMIRSFIEKVVIQGQPKRTLQYGRKLLDSSIISDVFSRGKAFYNRQLKEIIQIQESVSRKIRNLRLLIEKIIIQDVFSYIHKAYVPLHQYIRSFIETITISESLNQAVTASRKITETLSISDMLAYAYAKRVSHFLRFFVEDLSQGFGESLVRIVTIQDLINELNNLVANATLALNNLKNKIKKYATFRLGRHA